MATMFLYDKEFSMTNIKNLLVSHNRQEKQLNINSRINCTVENNDSKIMLEKLLGKLKKIKKESILKQIVSKSQQTNHNDDDLICLKKEMNDLTHEDINFQVETLSSNISDQYNLKLPKRSKSVLLNEEMIT